MRRALVTAGALLFASPALAQRGPADTAPEGQVRLPTDPTSSPAILDNGTRRYRPGALVPPGYRVVESYHTGALASGVVLLGFNWGLGVLAARAELSLADDEVARREGRNNALMAPVIGPFVALGTDDARPGGEVALLLVNGVAQLGGLGLIALGLALEQRWLVREEVRLSPAGLTVSWR